MTTTIPDTWPELPLREWEDTYKTLHMWTQIVGKIHLKLTPLLNHWWNVTLYVTPRGLTTSTMSYKGRHFQVDFDFISHLPHHPNLLRLYQDNRFAPTLSG